MAAPAENPSAPPIPAAGGARWRPANIIAELRHLPAWARRNPLRAVVTAGAVVAVPACLLALGWFFLPAVPKTFATVDQALAALDSGDHAEARRIALEV